MKLQEFSKLQVIPWIGARSYGFRGFLGVIYASSHSGLPTHSNPCQVVASLLCCFLLVVVEKGDETRIFAGKRR